MKKTGVMIKVTAKGDFGYSPHLGMNIVKESQNDAEEPVPAEYTIDEGDWSDELFNRPSPEWLSIPEREAAAVGKETKSKGGK